MKLYHIFLLNIAVLVVLGGLLWMHPGQGITLYDDVALQYPTIAEVFAVEQKKEEPLITMNEILEDDEDIDELTPEEQHRLDSLKQKHKSDSIRAWQLKLHYKDDDPSVLYPFFETLLKSSKKGEAIRIFHYGDSQIEGDRITGYMRYKLQNKFGGKGPGLQPATPLVHSMAINQENTENWKRFTFFGIKDTLVTHRKYGMLAAFGRFAPLHNDTLFNDSLLYEGSITFKPKSNSFSNTKRFDKMRLFYGFNTHPVSIEVYDGAQLLVADTLQPTETPKEFTYSFAKSPAKLILKFKGHDSPDIYGVSLEGNSGVIVDNISMRGSSGTIFRAMNPPVLRELYKNFNTKLIILQYGGNAIPFMESEKEIAYYVKNFERNINYLKGFFPKASFIVIGPSDMSVKKGTKWETYKYLETVRDGLKQAAFNAGAAYWDIYEAMGGEGSMPQWVEAEPALATSDHVHFNRRGARKVAQWFYNALVRDFNEYVLLHEHKGFKKSDTLRVDVVQ